MATASTSLEFSLEKLTISGNDNGDGSITTSFAGHTLFLPAVSVGNVGQLTTDLLLSNLPEGSTAVKIGRIFHPSLEAVVGADCLQSLGPGESPGLMTSCEIFHVKESKYVIIHFHAPVTMKGRQDFVDALMSWIEEKQFTQVVVFSSVFAADRIDLQLVGLPFRFLTTESTPQHLLQKLTDQEWKPIERREFPAPAVLDSKTASGNNTEGILHLPGSGITKNLYESCTSMKIPFLALIMFASEGDNTPEALTLFQMADKVFSFRNLCNSPDNENNFTLGSDCTNKDISPSRDRLVVPISWTQFRDDSHPSLY